MQRMTNAASLRNLRGLACMLLVGYHVLGSNPSNGLRLPEDGLRVFNDALAVVRMPLFGVLAGFVYALNPGDVGAGQFALHKAKHLLLPMFAVGTLFALMQAIVPGTHAPERNWLLLHIEPVGHFWFVQSLFWVSISAKLLELAGLFSAWSDFACVACVAVALHLCGPTSRWLGLDGALYLLPYFLAGWAAQRSGLFLGPARGVLIAPLAAAALLALFAIGSPTPDPDRRTALMLVAGLSLCGLLMASPPRSRLLTFVGEHGYAIFLFHVFFTAAARIVMNALGANWLPLVFVVGLVSGIAGPIGVERMASRTSLTRLLLLGQSSRSQARPVAVQRGAA
jgi:fucose 4-O-acetylase-like acetyltransferase